MTDLLSEDELAGLKALRELAETLPPYDWQWTTLTGENGPYQSHEDMIEGIAKTIRHSESLGLHAITWNDEDVDGRSSVVCTTGNGPTSPLHAQYIAAVKPSNILRLLSHIDALTAELAREEKSHSITIDARDLAEDALSEIWCNVFGGDPNWSNLYGFPNAVNDIEAQFEKLRSQAATARTSALKEAAEVAKNKQDKTFTPSWNDACVHIERAILAIAEVK